MIYININVSMSYQQSRGRMRHFGAGSYIVLPASCVFSPVSLQIFFSVCWPGDGVCCADKCHNPTKCQSPRQMPQQPSTKVTANDKCHNIASKMSQPTTKLCQNFASINVAANDKSRNFAFDKCHSQQQMSQQYHDY